MLKSYSCKIPANISYMSYVVNDILFYMQNNHGLADENILFDLKVILNELILNAIKHGSEEDNKNLVKIVAGIAKDNYIYLVVEDNGEGYNYNCLLENNQRLPCYTDLTDLKENGRGILIVKNLCDKLSFNKKGNKVLVVKRLH